MSSLKREDHEGDLFGRRGVCEEGRNDGAEGHPRRIVTAAHRSIAGRGGIKSALH